MNNLEDSFNYWQTMISRNEIGQALDAMLAALIDTSASGELHLQKSRWESVRAEARRGTTPPVEIRMVEDSIRTALLELLEKLQRERPNYKTPPAGSPPPLVINQFNGKFAANTINFYSNPDKKDV